MERVKNQVRYLFTFLGIGLVYFFVLFILGFDGYYGQDSYAYLQYGKALKNYFLQGNSPGSFYWPPLYSLTSSVIDLVLQNHLLSGQIVSILSWMLTGYFAFKTLNLLFPNQKHSEQLLFAITFILFSPYLLRFGGLGMSESLCVFLISLSVYFYFKNSFLVLAFAILAFSTRYPSLIITSPFVISFIYKNLITGNLKTLSLSLLIGILAAIPYLIFHGPTINTTLVSSIESTWSIANFFQREFQNSEGKHSYEFINLIYSLYALFHPAFIFAGIPLLIFCIRERKHFQDKSHIVLWISLLIYLLFICGIPYQNKRFLVLTIPIVGLIIYPIWLKFFERFSFRYLTHCSLLVNLCLSGITLNTVLNIHQKEMQVIEALKNYENQNIYTFELDISMKSRGFDSLINLWEKPIQHFKKGSYTLLNIQKWKNQWKNHQLMKNCQNLINFNHLDTIKVLNDGWVFLKIRE